MQSARPARYAGFPGKSWPIQPSPRISASWGAARSRAADEVARSWCSFSVATGDDIERPAHRALVASIRRGTSEHPEELTDRCCLSALAGLSKYLPLLGAWDIIVIPCDYVNFGRCASLRLVQTHTRLPCGHLFIKEG